VSVTSRCRLCVCVASCTLHGYGAEERLTEAEKSIDRTSRVSDDGRSSRSSPSPSRQVLAFRKAERGGPGARRAAALVARGRGGPSARRKCPTPHGLPRLATTQTRTRRGQPTGRRRARPRRRSLAEMRCARKQRRTCAQRTGSRPLAPPPQLDATVKVCRACQNGAQRLYHIGRLGRVAVEAASGASALRCVASSTAAKAALRRAAPPASRRTRRSA
jgi:hypothetical protein